MLLKFTYTENGSIEDYKGDTLSCSNIGPTISLQSPTACIIDITSDPRTKLLNKRDMVSEKFKVEPGIFFMKKPIFISMAKLQNRNRENVEALQIRYKDNLIIITGDKSYVFLNGKAVNVEEYELDENGAADIHVRIEDAVK